MLTPNTLLQDRYRVQRQIGGGGMGVVYLTEDNRLPGRLCAIKEMSPESLPPDDRAWAVQAFRQEAQMLAKLSHSGLTAVTDFFTEGDQWYLVMDYVEGEPLSDHLQAASGGRLPLEEALDITRQICQVLEYLHEQDPPVVFRDLKPGNVMLTPKGEVKLIDFGIARFFKPGQTRDTMNLGTPGYAAPEQYGGLGQSDPRTDVYSLGALLLQMTTGFNPAAAVTPFPLPPPGSVMQGVPPHVEAAVSKATQMQPDRRFETVGEMRQALFQPVHAQPAPTGPRPTPPPQAHPATARMDQQPRPAYTPPPPARHSPPPSPRRSRTGLWVGIGLGGLLLIGLCTGGLIGLANILPRDGNGRAGITPAPPTVHPLPPPTEGPGPATSTPRPDLSPTAAVPAGPATVDLGTSVQGRALTLSAFNPDAAAAVVVVGSIQGDQVNTRELVIALTRHLESNPDQWMPGVRLYLMPTLNPDGNVANSRYNANDVDLNRNWGSSDWTSNAAVPGYPEGKPGSGGTYPFSEPETIALRDFLLGLRPLGENIRVVVLHSSVRRDRGEIYPGGEGALDVARRYAGVTGYDVEGQWAEYVTSGEMVTWCDELRITAIDVVIPGSQTPSSTVPGTGRSLIDLTVEALQEIARFP